MPPSDILAAAPEAGVVATLVTVVFYFMRSNSADRTEAAKALTTEKISHSAVVEKLNARVDELEAEVETERRARYRAEERASHYRRQLGLGPEDTEEVRRGQPSSERRD